jgi:hypothetical protein
MLVDRVEHGATDVLPRPATLDGLQVYRSSLSFTPVPLSHPSRDESGPVVRQNLKPRAIALQEMIQGTAKASHNRSSLRRIGLAC